MMDALSFADQRDGALAAYREAGFHVERDVLTSSECDTLVERARHIAGPDDTVLGPIMMPHRVDDIFLETMKDRRIIDIIECIIAGKVDGLQTEFFFCKPGTKGFALHQDNYFVEADPESFISAWIALTDVTPETGGLILYPGTQLGPLLPVRPIEDMGGAEGQDINANNEESIVPTKFRPLSPSVSKGSAVILHAQVVHGSHENRSSRFRYALLNTYIRSGGKFRPGKTARRAPVPL